MAAKREELLKLAQSPEDRTLLSQFLDKQRQAERYVRPASTAFLDLRQQTLCRQAMQAAGVGGWSLEGGFAQAERRVALFLPDYIQEAGQLPEEDWPFRALRLEIRGQKPLTHRDYLGSLMGLGLRRETIGDILALLRRLSSSFPCQSWRFRKPKSKLSGIPSPPCGWTLCWPPPFPCLEGTRRRPFVGGWLKWTARKP